MGRRRRAGREPAPAWWAGFAFLLVLSIYLGSWRLLLITLGLWCLYEVLLVPTTCKVVPNGGAGCQNPVRGRAFGCGKSHQNIKNDALWRIGGLQSNPLRPRPPQDPNRLTGELVWSPDNRGAMDSLDRRLLLVAATGTLVVIGGMAFGLTV